jgi:RNA polymerase sigma-70 factor (ECF subfamily)
LAHHVAEPNWVKPAKPAKSAKDGDCFGWAAMALPVTDDCTDLAAHGAGDRHAFGRLYDRHAAVVLSFCRRGAGRVGDQSEDAMQETFLRAHRKLDQVNDCRGFRSWLLTIAGYVSRERRRSAARYAAHVNTAAAPSLLAGRAELTPHQHAAHADDLARLSVALDQLPDDERLAIHLQYLEHDPVLAARAALGLSRSGFYKLLARAREHLARIMSVEAAA